MNNQTPVRSFRLSDETMEQLREAAERSGATVARMLSQFAAATSKMLPRYSGVPLEGYAAAEEAMAAALPPTEGSFACPLGYGHTAHVWELTGGPSAATGTYRCAGQPFSDGWDPIDDPTAPLVAAVNGAAPHIVENVRRRTIRDVITRLEGFAGDVQPYVVTHFRSLVGDDDLD